MAREVKAAIDGILLQARQECKVTGAQLERSVAGTWNVLQAAVFLIFSQTSTRR